MRPGNQADLSSLRLSEVVVFHFETVFYYSRNLVFRRKIVLIIYWKNSTMYSRLRRPSSAREYRSEDSRLHSDSEDELNLYGRSSSTGTLDSCVRLVYIFSFFFNTVHWLFVTSNMCKLVLFLLLNMLMHFKYICILVFICAVSLSIVLNI